MSVDIDVVYTWVNHDDPNWIRMYQQTNSVDNQRPNAHVSVNNIARFQNRNEILYSIKSVKAYAPWVKNIYIVTNCEIPAILQDDKQIIPVAHEEIFEDVSVLPTFNSRAIEANLHRIPSLSERFIYFNDDVFLCCPVSETDFFSKQGKAYIFPSKHDVPYGKTVGLRPIDYGVLNAAELIIRDYGYTPLKKLHHAPFPILKSNLVELAQRYKGRFVNTSSHKFRDNSDIPAATTLHAYYSLVMGRGELKEVKSRYIDIGDPLFVFLILPFSPLRRGKYLSFCLNEVTGLSFFASMRDRIVRQFLETMFDG